MRQKGILTLTNPTSDVSFSITALRVYNIFASCQHCTPSASNPSTILQGSTATMVFTASSGYKMPSTAPTISTASVVSWTVSTTSTTDDTATLVISNPTGDVSFTVTGSVQSGLIGTTWQFNNDIDDFYPNEWNVSGTMVSGSYSLNVIEFSATGDYYDMHFDTSTVDEFYYGGNYWECYLSRRSYRVSAPRITFTGGSDLTNEDFVSWLNDNASKIS